MGKFAVLIAKPKAKVFEATSKSGNTRRVVVDDIDGQLVATFFKIPLGGKPIVSKPQAVGRDVATLARFVATQPGMFMKWVDSRLGV